MKKIAVYFLLSLSFPLYALTETFLRMPPNQAYMNFALTHYITWHASRFQSNFYSLDGKTNNFISRAVDRIDHWLVPGSDKHYQILIGHELQGKRLNFIFRIFIHPELRNDPLLKNLPLPQKWITSFLEWDSSGKYCVLGGEGPSLMSLRKMCRDKEGGRFIHVATENASNEIHRPWPNPFPYLTPWEIRSLSGSEIQRIFYSTTATHPSGIPRGLDNVIYLHGVEGHFPFDKYSISKDGKMTVYYP